MASSHVSLPLKNLKERSDPFKERREDTKLIHV
jgi:hypothetical protein